MVISDHKNLEYFLTTKQLNRRQVRWLEILFAFHFVIQHRPGAMNGRADALSHQVDVIESQEQDPRPLLKLAALESCEVVWADLQILNRIQLSTQQDPTLQLILAYFTNGSDRTPVDVRRRF